jgi:uncharacterized membrane protein
MDFDGKVVLVTGSSTAIGAAVARRRPGHGVGQVRVIGMGHFLLAVGFAGLGILSLLSGDFALNWQPVPLWVPWRSQLAYFSGVVLLACGVGLLLKRSAWLSALTLTIDVLIWLLVLQIPRVAAHPSSESTWLGFSENLVLVAGGWTLLISLGASDDRSTNPVVSEDSVRVARFLFAASLPLIGLSHFVYSQLTAAMVPTWLPNRVALAYLTGVAHMAAGVGLLLGVLPRLASTLEATMLSLFTLLVWVPRVVAAPASRAEWTAMLVSAALTGAAWVVARSAPYGSRRAPVASVGQL